MHRWTLTTALALSAALAAWISPSHLRSPTPAALALSPPPVRPLALPATADGPLELTVALDQGAVPVGTTARRYLVATVSAPASASVARLPVDLALVMDVSGSMSGSGKITEARRAAAALVDALGPEDNFALVSFSDRADVRRSLGRHAHAGLKDLIESLEPDGGTNLSAGLEEGFREAVRGGSAVHKVLLMTDGQANQGTTSLAGLTALARHPTTTLSTVGFGLEFNENLLSAMADAGSGRYRYVGAGTDLTAAYAEELDDAAHLVASGNRLVVEFAEGVVPQRVFQWTAELGVHDATVAIGDLAAGQSRTIVIEVDVSGTTLGAREIAAVRVEGAALPDRTAFREVGRATAEVVSADTSLTPWLDRAAMTVATRAVAGWSALEANAAYQQGDAPRAKLLLRGASSYMSRQNKEHGLAIPEAEAEQLNTLGYLDDGAAQKGAYSAARSLGRGE